MSRRHILILGFAATCLVGTAVPVAASPLTDRMAIVADPELRGTLREFAACKAGRYSADVRTVLREDLDVATMQDRFPKLMAIDCLKPAVFHAKKLSIVSGFYQAYMAEALLRRDYAVDTLPSLASVPPLKHDTLPAFDEQQVSDKLRKGFAVMREEIALEAVAECVARAVPASTYRFVTSKPDSAPETDGFVALQPAITPCLREGNVAALPTYGWRYVLAPALYRLVDAARPVNEQVPHA